MEAQGEHDIERALASGVNVDQHELIAMAGTTAMSAHVQI